MKSIYKSFLNIFIPNILRKSNGQKPKIVAKNREHLEELIYREIYKNGSQCSLNHIDVSRITNMAALFDDSNLLVSNFNGDISQWNVSNVEDMYKMFYKSSFNGDLSNWDTSKVKIMRGVFARSQFNGDLSQWNTSNVEDMSQMFCESVFNGDISKWDVSYVINMKSMFSYSQFDKDLSDWDVSKVEIIDNMFEQTKAPIPYWFEIEDQLIRSQAIEKYNLNKELNKNLEVNNRSAKKLKI